MSQNVNKDVTSIPLLPNCVACVAWRFCWGKTRVNTGGEAARGLGLAASPLVLTRVLPQQNRQATQATLAVSGLHDQSRIVTIRQNFQQPLSL